VARRQRRAGRFELSALVAGFTDLGYVEGRTIVLMHRFPNEEPARFRAMAGELVGAGVDALVVIGANAAPYGKEATATIPVIFALVPDPLGTKLVTSLARPEANVTGLSNSASDLIGKRLQILTEIIPGLSQVAPLVNANSQLAASYIESTRAAAANLGLMSQAFTWRSPEELEQVFAAMKSAGIRAITINPDGWAFTHRQAIAQLALAHGIALSAWSKQTFDAGALMSYGVNHDAICRRVAVYVDKVLRGTKPGDLPVEQPTKFELFISLKTAKKLGLEIPPSMLSRADLVVE
jgi:putative ABC transport system substrate-binding protein